jgi:hypothetical protein
MLVYGWPLFYARWAGICAKHFSINLMNIFKTASINSIATSVVFLN